MMFHIKYPQCRGFYSWDELGCLARALGFPKGLFKINISHEIAHEDDGLPEKELLKMLEYNLLFKSLHLSLNNHTADWNCCVIRKCLSILDKQALTFEDLYNIRVAYQAYEAADMKGMAIEKYTMLRTLKMCGKTISPMKLMHRVKHSKDSFEEEGRMQLYEFLDLILWANEYEPYTPQKTYGHFEMEDEMFKLVDFDSLLSHHDQRLADRLDQEYLDEECTFSREKHGDRGKFKEPPVACSDARMEMARNQKKIYQGLKNEVTSSQKMVYYSQQGFIRARPLTAPNLTMYKQKDEDYERKMSEAAHTALFNKYQKILKNVYNRGKVSVVSVDCSDKPFLQNYHKRCETPRMVTEADLKESTEEFRNIMFDKETAKARYEIRMDTEMDHYIPDYKEKWLEKKENAVNPKELLRRKAWEEKNYKYAKNIQMKDKIPKVKEQKVGHYDNKDIINHLAYPVSRLPPSHARKCDARFRGWYDTRSKRGTHYILASPFFNSSPKGRLMQKLAKMSDEEISKLHGEFLFRYTKKNQVENRPVTAPSVLTKHKELKSKSPSSGYGSMEDKSTKNTFKLDIDVPKVDQFRQSTLEKVTDKEIIGKQKSTHTDDILENIKVRLDKMEGKRLTSEETASEKGKEPPNPTVNLKFAKADTADENTKRWKKEIEEKSLESEKPDITTKRENRTTSRESNETSVTETITKLIDDKPKTKVRSKSADVKRYDRLQNENDGLCMNHGYMQPRSKSAMESGASMKDVGLVPIPYMDHSKPKLISVGSIGKISLLESISESKYWEDVLLEELAKRQAEQNFDLPDSHSESAFSDHDSNEDFEHLKNPRPKKIPGSKSSQGPKSAILALVLEEEKARRRKVRNHHCQFSVLRRSPRSQSTKSLRSYESTSSATSSFRNVKHTPEKKTPTADSLNSDLSESIQETTEEIVKKETSATISNQDKMVKEKENPLPAARKETDVKISINYDSVKTNSGDVNIPSSGSNLNKSNLEVKQDEEKDARKLKTNDEFQKQKKVIILSCSSMDKFRARKKSVKRFERLVNRMDGTISNTLTRRLLSERQS